MISHNLKQKGFRPSSSPQQLLRSSPSKPCGSPRLPTLAMWSSPTLWEARPRKSSSNGVRRQPMPSSQHCCTTPKQLFDFLL